MQKFKFDNLENINNYQIDKNYNLINTIIADKANIKSKQWLLSNVKILNEDKKNEYIETYDYKSSFNGKIISNLYSNLNSLNIFQLIKLKKIINP